MEGVSEARVMEIAPGQAMTPMKLSFGDVPPRALTGWKTAYPRVSKRGTDPATGLATVEALFLALHILGRPTDGLLDHYHWKQQFLEANKLLES